MEEIIATLLTIEKLKGPKRTDCEKNGIKELYLEDQVEITQIK